MGLAAPGHMNPPRPGIELCIGRQILNHWTTREVLHYFLKKKIQAGDLYELPDAGTGWFQANISFPNSILLFETTDLKEHHIK